MASDPVQAPSTLWLWACDASLVWSTHPSSWSSPLWPRVPPHTPEDHFEGLPHEFTFASHAPDSVSPCCLSPPWLVHPTINTSIILSAGAVLSGSFMRVEFVSTHRCFPSVWYRLSPCQGLSMDWFLCFSFCSDFSSLPNVFSI